jgi:transcriptional regulator with XRE-family HTH domain
MSSNHDIPFGAWIKRLRALLDLTQERLAEQVGCAVQTIRTFERETRRPSRMMAERLADILEVPATERAHFLRLARARGAREFDTGAAPSHSGIAALAQNDAGEGRREPSGGSAPPAPQARPAPPTPPADLIGRAEERATLLDRLRTPGRRLITLVGPGGIGKTSLALRVAAVIAADDAPAIADGVAVVATRSRVRARRPISWSRRCANGRCC